MSEVGHTSHTTLRSTQHTMGIVQLGGGVAGKWHQGNGSGMQCGTALACQGCSLLRLGLEGSLDTSPSQ